MRRLLFAASAYVLIGLPVATADDPPASRSAGQPTDGEARPVPPRTATDLFSMNRLEEEVELLEARRETRKAYVKSATVRVEVAKITAEQNAQLAARGAVRPEEALQAKLELAAAAALVVIRERELQEVEVMLKYARKRLEQAKAAPERPGSAGKDR